MRTGRAKRLEQQKLHHSIKEMPAGIPNWMVMAMGWLANKSDPWIEIVQS